MSDTRLLDLVDARDFRGLFIDELGWTNPDQTDRQLGVDGRTYTLTQVAGYKGLRVWYCAELPNRKTQRAIDELIGRDSHERLVIFADEVRHEWRWPRRAQTGGANAKLLAHEHAVGASDPHLTRQLAAIAIDFDDDLPLVDLLSRMRQAFDAVAETASVEAARLMGTLYSELDNSGVDDHNATLLLARLLFLLFGDDTGMWETGTFERYLVGHTSDATLHADLKGLFPVLNTAQEHRDLPVGSPYAGFRYINGGLFADPLNIAQLTSGFRSALLAACEFDWGVISPAVFGSMFQTVKNKEARRHGGEHYTTEQNILRTIGPLFLDEYRARFDTAQDDKGLLTKLHNELGRLRFLDPACGCGNFLVVAYRELRALELDLLMRRRALQLADYAGGRHPGQMDLDMSLDVAGDIKVTLDHFYGIEIEEWPARIAQTAMLLVDHLANQRMDQEFGIAPDRLPIAIAPTIHRGNALHTNWADLVPPSDDVIILGNPPFIGQYTKTPTQTSDTKLAWGARWNGYLDYVTCWYARAIDYYGKHRGRWAFVSTNSICQGEPVEYLWRPILAAGWRCRFAHRSFQWTTETADGAVVHVSIIGFDKAAAPKPILWTYPEGGKGDGTPQIATRINPYLIDGPNVLVSNRTTPLSRSLPPVIYGSKPTDGKHLLVSRDEYDSVAADPVAEKYLRRFIGARELLHDSPRWCLWLVGAPRADITRSSVLRERTDAVEEMRSDSSDAATNRAASWPHLFQYDRQPQTSYLAIPRHVGEHREYFTAARYDSAVICGDANFMVADPDGVTLGVLSSSMFIAWMRAIGGRIKSDLRFSNTFTYNTFPLPSLTAQQRARVVEAAAEIIAAREAHPGASLATLYEPGSMSNDLATAHDSLDRVVDGIFDLTEPNEADRQKVLFRRYAKLTGQETLIDI